MTIKSQISHRCVGALSLLLPLRVKGPFLIPSLVFWQTCAHKSTSQTFFKKHTYVAEASSRTQHSGICILNLGVHSGASHALTRLLRKDRCVGGAVGGAGGDGSVTATELILAAAAGSGVLMGKEKTASARSACEVEPEPATVKGACYTTEVANQANMASCTT